MNCALGDFAVGDQELAAHKHAPAACFGESRAKHALWTYPQACPCCLFRGKRGHTCSLELPTSMPLLLVLGKAGPHMLSGPTHKRVSAASLLGAVKALSNAALSLQWCPSLLLCDQPSTPPSHAPGFNTYQTPPLTSRCPPPLPHPQAPYYYMDILLTVLFIASWGVTFPSALPG